MAVLKSTGHVSQLKTQAAFLCVSRGAKMFLLGKPQSLLLRSLTDWLRPTHNIVDHLFNLKSTDCKC